MAPAPKDIMKLSLASSLTVLATTSFAFAQGPQTPAVQVQPTAAPAAQPAPAAPRADSGGFCGLGEALGVNPDEATVATRYICGEIWNQSAGKPGAGYRVHYGKLGAKILVTVEATDSAGMRDERHIEVVALDEVTVAAPRIAKAIVNKTSVKDTETADNVLGNEAKASNQKRGAVKLEGGIVGTTLIGPPAVAPAAGLNLQLDYVSERALVYMGFRFGISPALNTIGVHAGADYHLSDADIAPFVGGGAVWSALKATPDDRSISGSGFGVFVEAGVTMFRTNRTNFRVGVRADIPWYALQEETRVPNGAPSQYGYQPYTTQTSSRYAVPVSLTVGVAMF
jgi:hypothetical protein